MKRVIITLTAMALFGALGSAARAQTPAQTAKWNRYMSRHPGVAQQAGVNPLATGVPNYMTNYPGSPNSYNAASAGYEAKYQRNLATYQNYMAMHPGMAQQLAAQQGMTTGLPYGAGYPGLQNYGGYANPMMQQLSSIPIISSLAPMLGGYGGGGYGAGGRLRRRDAGGPDALCCKLISVFGSLVIPIRGSAICAGRGNGARIPPSPSLVRQPRVRRWVRQWLRVRARNGLSSDASGRARCLLRLASVRRGASSGALDAQSLIGPIG